MNLHSNTNPFEPSESTIAPELKSPRVIHSPLVLSIQWTVVVLVNLIVPYSRNGSRGSIGRPVPVLSFDPSVGWDAIDRFSSQNGNHPCRATRSRQFGISERFAFNG